MIHKRYNSTEKTESMREKMEPIIKVENLTKTFTSKSGNVEAVRNVNFEVEKGDIFGIIGLSGAGKSTLVRCLNLLEKPTGGKVIVNGKDLTKLSEKELRKERQNIGMIFQHFNLLMQRNVLGNVCFPMEIAGIKKNEAKKRAYELLKIVGLETRQLRILHSFPEDSSREWQLQGYWQTIRTSFFVMRQQVHWILRLQNQYLSY